MRIVLLLAVVGSGCAHVTGPMFDSARPSSRPCRSRWARSRCATRALVIQQGFDTPVVSTPRDSEQRPLPLADATARELKRRLADASGAGPQRVDAEIVLRKGVARFDAGWLAETASADAELDVIFTDPKTRAVVLTRHGWSSGSQSSLDVADEEPNQLLQAAVLAALDRALSSHGAEVAPASAAKPL